VGPALPEGLAARGGDGEEGAGGVGGGGGGVGGRAGAYGGGLRPGEGALIAQYVAANKRVPRRGEVGWEADQIERLENVGYVMSGSRHKRMNEVRLRKENQVLSAEEKRSLALLNIAKNAEREATVMGELKAMVAQLTDGVAGPAGVGTGVAPGAGK
jgi:hypothetical protein